MLTGSGSALYGVFRSREELEAALPHFRKELVFPFVFVSRERLTAPAGARRLRPHIDEELWPPAAPDEN